MGYDAAEQAYGEHRFAEAQALLNEHLTEQPNDPRAVLLQAYIHFYGFQDTAAAASSYRQVLELEAEGSYHDLASEGLKQCPVNERGAKPAEPTVEPAQTKEPTDENERPPATPWLAELRPQQEQAKQPKPKPEPDPEPASKPQAPQHEEPQIAISYAMAEQAYQERDFTAAQQVLNALLAESPNDLRCLLLQGYVRSFGFHDEPAAITSYQRVLELEVEGPYRDLAIEGLSQCGVNLDPAPAEPVASEPDPAAEAADLSSLAEAVVEPEEAPQPEPKPKKTETTPPTKTASEQALADGWLLVDLSAQR